MKGEKWKRDNSAKFEVGDKVVCVNASFSEWAKAHYTALPEAGKVYAVRYSRKGAVCLVGIIGIDDDGDEVVFEDDLFVSIADYRKRVAGKKRLESIKKEVADYWKMVDSADENGNLPRRGRPRKKSA